MYQTRSSTKVPLVKKQIVLTSRSANFQNLQNSKIVRQETNTKELSNMILRKRNRKNELKQINQDKSMKDGLNKIKASNRTKSKQGIQTTGKENVYHKKKTNNLKKSQNKMKAVPNNNVNQYASDSISKSGPIWKCKPNDTVPLLQKRKKPNFDIYDIAEDEDLQKEELTNKREKKQKVRKKCSTKIYKKQTFKPIVKRNILVAKENLPVLSMNKNFPDQNIFKSKNVSKLNFKSQSTKCVNCTEKQDQIHSFNEIRSVGDSLSYKTQQSPKNLEKSEINGENVPIKINNLNIPRQMPHELTPVKKSASESQKNAFLESASNDINEYETLSLIPKMTSTPESHSPVAPVYALPLKCFDTRMSEIPLVSGKCTEVVDIASAEELLNAEMQSVRSMEVSLFVSPPKVECHKQISNSKIVPKKLQMNIEYENCPPPFFTIKDSDFEIAGPCVENHTDSLDDAEMGDSLDDMNEQDLLLFGTPPKLHPKKSEKKKELVKGLSRVKLNKSRKSYDNRDQNKKLISNGTKKRNKKKTAAMKKEEILIQSLNEHFSELENFELCLE